ncbi:hypothetical protein Enr13x_14240 [Stieleria neptunia]|uniref:PEP-CTERM protein-sorting domain-containing protein n=1 Tax=Stieleria neptunia TaxID=2527979 RepID=A0A518HL52_9BACT|nr:hypothetical protein [Stieleria neptunia]QDV41581.1 hypothetical protein Enr13x_14240 [Stieleria neptunia]
MFHRLLDRRSVWPSLIGVIAFGWFGCLSVRPCPADIVAYLAPSRAATGERFETDLVLSGTADAIGDVVEWINLDIVESTINATPLTDYGRVRFDARTTFAAWFDGRQFGTGSAGFESQIVLESFLPAPPVPFEITNTDPFEIGTLTFDYSGLGLQPGDTITLDIFGVPDGSSTRTTSIAIRPSGAQQTMLVNPVYTSPLGSEQSRFTIPTAIPEPGSAAFLMATLLGVYVRRCRRGEKIG